MISDYSSNMLFWVDAKLHQISSSDLNGNNRQVILYSHTYLKHPFAISVFEVRASYLWYVHAK